VIGMDKINKKWFTTDPGPDDYEGPLIRPVKPYEHKLKLVDCILSFSPLAVPFRFSLSDFSYLAILLTFQLLALRLFLT
jgi:hypothetical protein